MVQCPRCATSVQWHQVTCPECGTRQKTVRRTTPVLAGVLAGATPAAARATRRSAGLPEHRDVIDLATPTAALAPPPARPTVDDQPVIIPSPAPSAPAAVPTGDEAPRRGRRVALVAGAVVGVLAIGAAVTLLGPDGPTTTDATPTAAAPAGPAAWQSWTTDGCSCTVELPAAPVDRSADLPGSAQAFSGTMVRAGFDRAEVSFGFQQMRPGWSVEPTAALDAGVAAITVVDVVPGEDTTIAGLPARRFTGRDATSGRAGEGVVVARGANLYYVVVVGEDVRPTLDRVVGSFRPA